MRILTTLTYYSPHISGLTVYAARVAKGLVQRGHHVTVITSHYDHDLPRRASLCDTSSCHETGWRICREERTPGERRA
jgi:glycogen synthase